MYSVQDLCSTQLEVFCSEFLWFQMSLSSLKMCCEVDTIMIIGSSASLSCSIIFFLIQLTHHTHFTWSLLIYL